MIEPPTSPQLLSQIASPVAASPVAASPVAQRPAWTRTALGCLLLAALSASGCREETGSPGPTGVGPAPPAGGAGADAAPRTPVSEGVRARSGAALEPLDPELARALLPPTELPESIGNGLLDEAAARGLDYVNVSGEPEKATILEAGGAGVALFDLDSDGDLDIAFSQGLATLGALLEGPGADIEIFRNDGSGQFTRAPGPGLSGWWTGLAAGDVDNDGDDDLVCGGFGSLRVVLQADSGALLPGAELIADPARRLTPGAPREPGLPPDWITSLALFDADRDGNLDLYAGHYLDLDPVAPTLGQVGQGPLALPCRWKGLDVYCGPHGLVPQADKLFAGNGGGAFEDRSASWLPGHVPGFTLAVGASDSDGDGDTDLYVANDSTANLMLVNEIQVAGGGAASPGGALIDYGLVSGVAVSQDGPAEAGMGVSWGDVNRDGQPDLAVTNFSNEPTALYFGTQTGFSNQTYRWGLNRASKALLSWGVHLVDFDGDGWLELFTANGHVYPQADDPKTGTSYGQADTIWSFGSDRKVLGWGTDDARSLLSSELPTRGSAVGDLDGDGRPDLVLARLDGPAALGINRLGQAANWLELRLASSGEPEAPDGPRTPRDAHGARVICVPKVPVGAPQFALRREVQTSGSYQSCSGRQLSMGLGIFEEYSELLVLWPSGRREQLPAGRANRRLWLEEGRGIVREEEL